MKLFSKLVLTAMIAFSAGITSSHATTILADWTFETSPPTGSGTDNGPYSPESGAMTAGAEARGHHASSSTTWSNPAGDGSSESFSSNNWGVDDYYQFSLSTANFDSIMVSFAQQGSATGPADFKFQYSTDGSTFTDFGMAYTVTASYDTKTFNLSAVGAVSDAATVYFRIVDNSTNSIGGGTVSGTGTDRVDDFVVSGSPTAVPENAQPTVCLLLGIGLLLGGERFLRRKAA